MIQRIDMDNHTKSVHGPASRQEFHYRRAVLQLVEAAKLRETPAEVQNLREDSW